MRPKSPGQTGLCSSKPHDLGKGRPLEPNRRATESMSLCRVLAHTSDGCSHEPTMAVYSTEQRIAGIQGPTQGIRICI